MGGEDVNLLMRDEEGDTRMFGQVADQKNGTYRLRYDCMVSGLYDIVVTLGGLIIPGLRQIQLLPGPIDVAKTEICNGAHLSCSCHGHLTAGKRTSFIIQARDSFGNKLVHGGEDFEVTMSQEVQNASIEDRGDGTYSVTYIWAFDTISKRARSIFGRYRSLQ